MFTLSASRFLPVFGLLLLAACSGGTSTEPEPEPEQESPADAPEEAAFELRVSNEKVPILQGTTVEVTVEVIRKNGFEGAVLLSIEDLPEGATIKSVTIEAGADEATVDLTASSKAPHSLPTDVELRGTAVDDEKLEASQVLTVTVCGHPGDVDTSFDGGQSVVPVGAGEDYASAMALAADGKILVAGRSAENQGDFALIRLERDGRLDTSFGEGGKVLTPVGASTDAANAIAVQKDGKIVVAGSASVDGSGLDFAVVRYLPNGQLDTSFGQGGKVITSLSEDTDVANAVIVQKDGKIVAAGEANQGSSGTGLDFALVRYDADGTLDESFGEGGKVLTPIASHGGRDVIYALTSQEIDGEERLIAAGGEGDFTIARYRENGELDTTFGDGGTISGVNGSVIGAARAVRVTPEGNILVAGHRSHDFALARFTVDGELDESFAGGAPLIVPVSATNWDEAQALAVDADGKIFLGGWAYSGNSSSGNFALVGVTSDGELDAEFGEGGVVITEVATNGRNDVANAILLQPDERIPAVRVLLAGSANGSNHDFAVTRYWR